MDTFPDNFEISENSEIDPAAEFLAREQSALAGLEDDLHSATGQPLGNGNATAECSGSFELVTSDDQQEQQSLKKGFANKEEPEKIKKWREEQKARLEEKDQEEEQKKAELRQQAKKELEEWYKHHEEAIAKTKASNSSSYKQRKKEKESFLRNAEKQFVAENDDIEPGTEWERIAKLCDFNPKSNKASKDVSRMRSIILQLKQSPIATSKKA